MLLKETLENLQTQNVKVGGGSQYNYCGEVNGEAYEVLTPYLEREVVDTYDSILEKDTTIVIFQSKNGDRKGKYWTIEEYNKKNHR